MSIASAIQTLTNTIRGIATTKGQIKTAVNTDIDFINNEQIEQYPSLIRNAINQYKSYIPVVTGEGKELSLNTVPLKMKEFAVKGDTFQQSYTGAQLLNLANLADKSSYDVDITVNQDKSFNINGTASSGFGWNTNLPQALTLNGDYTLILKCIKNINKNSLTLSLGDGSAITGTSMQNQATNGINVKNLTLTNQTVTQIRIYVNNGNSFSNSEFQVYLVSGTYTAETIPDYEPYVGGTASPNPDYPQDIQVVTGEQTVVIRGENQLYIENDQFTWNSIDISINNGTVTLDGTPSVNSTNKTIATFTAPEDGTYTLLPFKKETNSNIRLLYSVNSGSQVNSDSTPNISLSKNDIVTINLRVSATDTINNFTLKPMLYKGTETVTTYEPYITPTTKTLDLGNMELCKIGTYQDYIYKDNGNWYKHKVITKETLDGTEAWTKSTYATTIDRFIQTTKRPDLADFSGLCNYLTYTQGSTVKGYFYLDDATNNKGRVIVNFSDYGTTTLKQFKTWLSTHNLKLYYAETPVTEQITDTTLINQLEEIDNMNMNNGTTVIYADNEEGLQPTLYVKAYKKIEE